MGSEKRYVVPEGMVGRVRDALQGKYADILWTMETARVAATAFAEVLAEKPIVPSTDQVVNMAIDSDKGDGYLSLHIAVEWQRRMFLAPEPDTAEIDAHLAGILFDAPTHVGVGVANQALREAYLRGVNSKR